MGYRGKGRSADPPYFPSFVVAKREVARPPTQSFVTSKPSQFPVPAWSTDVKRASPRTGWGVLPFTFAILLSAFFFWVAIDPAIWAWSSRWFGFLAWPVFGDLGVTLEHFHQADDGLDPLIDPESAFAYPRAVLALRYFGFHHLPLPLLGALQAAAAMVGILLVLRPKAMKRSLATIGLLLTPPMLLGIERANLDFVLFLLCVVAARLWARAIKPTGLLLPVLGMGAGALLKLYPLFAILGAALAERGRRRTAWLLCALVVVGYWAWNAEEMGLIAQKIPVSTSASWGCLILFARLERFFGADPAGFVWLTSVKCRWLPWGRTVLGC